MRWKGADVTVGRVSWPVRPEGDVRQANFLKGLELCVDPNKYL